MAAILPIPGVVLGGYPERRRAAHDRIATVLGTLRALAPARQPRLQRFLASVTARDSDLAGTGTTAMASHVRAARATLARHGMTDAALAEAFALVKRICARVLGLDLYPSQLIAARVMLDRRLAEMATGEGKTLAAGVCAATAALAGIPVHVITANDYLVERDARILRPLFSALGLTVGAVTQGTEHAARSAIYDCDIVYCTASELVFDYLRDGLTRGALRSDLHQRAHALHGGGETSRPTLLRGLCMALVDEADSVLIDEARVPLVLSERCANTGEQAYLAASLSAARRLERNRDFTLDRRSLSANLTEAGEHALDSLTGDEAWLNRLHRSETVCTALAALHLYERDRHYLVRDDAVSIIDESTGRIAAGRIWSRGLHRLIELKEGCPPGSDTATVAQITYQRFFQRYLALCGMSGTLAEARGELASVYGLRVTRIPLTRRSRRTVLPTRVFPDADARWGAVVREAIATSRAGRPVLIGTDSLADSEALSARFSDAGQPHAVLNARQDSAEAQIVADAGAAGRITVATNMAGRGTDIELGPGVAERGGLHVICCQYNPSRRIDRQLVGRCARRGDPGSAQAMLTLDHPTLARFIPEGLACRIGPDGLDTPQWLVRQAAAIPQRLAESRQRAERRALLAHDRAIEDRMTFGRPTE